MMVVAWTLVLVGMVLAAASMLWWPLGLLSIAFSVVGVVCAVCEWDAIERRLGA